MLWHYLTTALHNLARHRLATLMHVLGLSFGLACFVVSYTFLDSLQHGEPHLANADRIYVLTQSLRIRNTIKEIPASPYTALPAYDPLKADFPQLAAIARVASYAPGPPGSNRITLASGDQSGFVYSLFADPEIFTIFHLKLLAGDPREPFKESGKDSGTAITASAARRIFGTTDVLGRRVMFAGRYPAVISAVIEDLPQPSHLGDSPRALLRFDTLSRIDVKQLPDALTTDWTSPSAFIYLALPANGSLSVAALRASLKTFGERHEDRTTGHSRFDVVPVSTVRRLMIDSAVQANAGISLTSSLYVLDALVLVVACFNYANLATALALRRSKEIALRKIVGARRRQLVTQCLVEAAVVGVLALVVAVAVALALIPVLSNVLGESLQPAAFREPRTWLFLGGLTFAAVTLAGVYPAMALSRLQPVEALRATAARTARYVPRALIGLQFAVAGFLIVMVLIVQGQNRLMRQALVGIARNPAVAVTTNIQATTIDMQTLRARLLESSAVAAVSGIDVLPWGGCCWVFVVGHSPDAAAKAVQAAGNRVGVDYFNTMGIKLLAGRGFREASDDEISPQDSGPGWGKRPFNVVIDRKLTEQLGYQSPAAAIGATLYRPTYQPVLTLRVIGVVENAASHLDNTMGSSSDIYLFTPKLTSFPIIRFRPERVTEAIAHLEKTWKSLAPSVPLERRFVDELFEEAYAAYATTAKLATGLTVAAFVIALMGLSGMAVQVTGGRLREIGIRKTLGAKSRQILLLLLIGFARPVLIANVIAWPFAYVAARAYVSLFLTPVPISPLVFLTALLASVIVACLVVCSQALRAARAQPAEVLRYE